MSRTDTDVITTANWIALITCRLNYVVLLLGLLDYSGLRWVLITLMMLWAAL